MKIRFELELADIDSPSFTERVMNALQTHNARLALALYLKGDELGDQAEAIRRSNQVTGREVMDEHGTVLTWEVIERAK